MSPPRVLVAGLGNIFLGDDGFGSAVIEKLRQRPLGKGVRVVDFGVAARELVYALQECDAAILVDATTRGEPPGTLYVLAPCQLGGNDALLDAHSLTADLVLSTLPTRQPPIVVRVVGCEPQTFEPDPGEMGLSPVVCAAVDAALPIIERLIAELHVELTAAAGAIAHA